jgi:diguanylate cyclase (GGDEF)-like protein
MKSTKPIAYLIQEQRYTLLLPATWIATLAGLAIIIQTLDPRLDSFQRFTNLILGATVIGYSWALYRWIYPLSERRKVLGWAIALVNAVGMAALAAFLTGVAQPAALVLFGIAAAISAICLARWPTHLFILVFTLLAFLLAPPAPATQPVRMAWLGITLLAFLLNEALYRLGNSLAGRIEHLETINRVSRTISATIETEKLISLVCAAVQEALLADTYFVGLFNDDKLCLELFYDDGQFFPPIEVPLENTLSGWVLTHQRSLLLRDLPKDIRALGVNPKMIGKSRPSLSWMGTPISVSKHRLGILAMASYQKNAFDQADLELLESMANQIALVIDNAYRYAEVEKQSRLDSLTQVYNHGQFLAYLNELSQYATVTQSPLSLIMLDVDYFKQYNDAHGHLAGDQALTQLVVVIRQHIRNSDILGRWGGEEFAILLPETNSQQAVQVAERIRMSVTTQEITTIDGKTLPLPTVSQGLAVLTEVGNAEKLVDLADQRLYLAKERGRNQIELPPSVDLNSNPLTPGAELTA